MATDTEGRDMHQMRPDNPTNVTRDAHCEYCHTEFLSMENFEAHMRHNHGLPP